MTFAGISAAVLFGIASPASAGPAQAAAAITPVNISRSSSDSTLEYYPSNYSNHSLGVDQNGKAYVIWYEWQNPRRFTFATNKSGSWSTPVEIEKLGWEHPESGYPVMAVSPAGNVHLMFHDGRGEMIDADIFHKSYDNGVWSATTNVSGVATGPSVYGGVAVSPVDGTAIVVWGENRADQPGEWLLIQRTRTASGQWSAVNVIYDYNRTIHFGYFPRLVIDARGTAHMIYGYGHTATLWYTKNATLTNPATWTTPILLRNTGIEWSFYDVKCDNAGNAYVAWDDAGTGNEEILVQKINANGSFGWLVNVSTSPGAVSSSPTLAVHPSKGDVLVAWAENANIYANALTNGTWTGPYNLTNSSVPCIQPCVAIDPAGGAHIVFATQIGGNWEVMYASYAGGITVLSPNGGESWYSGTSHNITWSSGGVSGNVKIDLSTDGGQSWSAVTASTVNTGSYAWTAPSTLSAACLIRVSNLDGTVTDKSDAVFSIVTAPTARIQLSRTKLAFGAVGTSAVTAHQSLIVSNAGTGAMSWTAVSNDGWLSVAPASGSGTGSLLIGVNPSGYGLGTQTGTVTVSSANALNSPQTITVTMTVYGAGASGSPFGYFETPLAGATVASSIPVTGWALDDVEIAGVKIYRTASAGEASSPPGLVFIGDAVLVEGARPDVEQAYPSYPRNYKAGWGYMLLTNFLPNSGNGTVTLVVQATDKESHVVELGRKTITCANAAATKPFGAIDTPTQGGTISGSSYVNFGWALTPLPAMIPINGSTISVYIDGVAAGNPTYNQYRSDIATYFPGYLNSNAAVGYWTINTTALANGVHTIAWSVTDNAGRTDGIGSRFFSVLNTAASPVAAESSGVEELYQDVTDLGVIPADPAPVLAARGFGKNRSALLRSENGSPFEAVIRETERLEIDLDRGLGDDWTVYRGYQIVGSSLRPLPAGSTLDPKSGVWTWQPGPGFFGAFDLVFIAELNGRPESRTHVRVRIIPF
jgi:hypothetical protein